MKKIDHRKQEEDLEKYMANLSILLRAMQSREQVSQDEMGERLGISRACFRNYAHNLRDNKATILLLLNVAAHENISIHRLLEILSGDTPNQAYRGKNLEKWKETLLNHFGFIAKPVRNRLIKFLDKDKESEVVFKGHRLSWLIDMIMMIADLPRNRILEIERIALEHTLARTKSIEEQYVLNKRLSEVSKTFRSSLQ